MERNSTDNKYKPLLIILIIVFASVCYLVFGPLTAAVIARLAGSADSVFLQRLTDYAIVNTPKVILFLAVLFGAKAILHTSLRDLVSDHGFRFRQYFKYLLISTLIVTLFSLVDASGIEYVEGAWLNRLMFLPFALIFTPIQCLSEELFYRVLPARFALGEKLKTNNTNLVILSIFSGFIFTLPHMPGSDYALTPDKSGLLFYYFSFGFLAMILSLYTEGFEVAIATHTAINLSSVLFVSYSESALTSFPILMKEGLPSVMFSNIALYSLFIVMIFLVTLERHRRLKAERKDG